jgi:proteic killer suppression protein
VDIFRVEITKKAEKDLSAIPTQCRDKLELWTMMVKENGLRETRKIKSFHDEPLKGKRKGERSIRLNKAYRAIYIEKKDGKLEFVSIEEVNKHVY